MYRSLRNVHLAVGLFSAIFLLAFGLSAAQMAYPIYRVSPRETTAALDIPPAHRSTPRASAQWLMDERGLRGDLTEVKASVAVVSLTIVRPGTTYSVQYDRQTGSGRVTTHVLNAVGLLNRIHHAHGIGHEYWVNNAWGWMLFVVSVALLVLAATGIVMWFTRHDDRRIGALVLGAGLTWGLTLLVLMRSS